MAKWILQIVLLAFCVLSLASAQLYPIYKQINKVPGVNTIGDIIKPKGTSVTDGTILGGIPFRG